MSRSLIADSTFDMSALIRNEPVQARSAARLTALLDAAAAVIDETGYERLTTAMVADRAGASIGTVYRYFPDRIALLQSLATRNADRLVVRVSEAIASDSVSDAQGALRAVVDVFVDAFRNEPSFASVRTGDVLDLRPRTAPLVATVLAGRIVEGIRGRFDVVLDTAEVDGMLAAVDGLLARAFAHARKGDSRIIEWATDLSASLVVAR